MSIPSDEERTIALPPFPPLAWTGFHWQGIVHLDSWRGFIPAQELCPWAESGLLPDGDLLLHVSSPTADSSQPPSQPQIVSFRHLLEHQAALREAVLGAVLAEYPLLRERYGDDVDEESMPRVSQASDLLRLLSPNIVHLLANPKDGFTRVGFGFDCRWDEEGGLGVSTHRGNVIAIGGADEAFSEYFPELEDKA